MDQVIGLSRLKSIHKIIGNLPAVVFEYTINPDGSRDFTYLSPRCNELLGLNRELLLSGKVPMKEFVHPEDWESLEEQIAIAVGSLKEFIWVGRIYAEDKTIWVEVKGSPIRLEDNSIVCHGIITDVTSQKEAEKTIQTTETLFTQLFHNAQWQ